MKQDIAEILSEFAIESYEQTAQTIDELRGKLGQAAVSIDEWNALVTASFELRLLAYRRRAHLLAHSHPEKQA